MPTYTPHRKILYQAREHLIKARDLLVDSFSEHEFPNNFPYNQTVERTIQAVDSVDALIVFTNTEINRASAEAAQS